MITVVVCSKNDPDWNLHEKNVAATIGVNHQYLRMNNSAHPKGICSVYNDAIALALHDLLVFVHEDVFFMEDNWGKTLLKKFEDQKVGLCGVAGTQALQHSDLRWHTAGQPYLRGRVIHEIPQANIFVLTVFSWDKADAEVVVADGLFLAIRKSLFSTIAFDEKTFTGFHFYDLDICMQIRKTHTCIVTWDLLVKHFSAGKNDPTWHAGAKSFSEKYEAQLPALIPGLSLPIIPGAMAQNFDLTGKASTGIRI